MHYALDGNGTAAYRLAYDCTRMKPESVHRTAHRLLQVPKISSRIDAYVTAERNRIKRKYHVDTDRLMEQYVRLGFSDIRKLFHDHGGLKDIHDLDDDIAPAVGSIKVSRRMQGDDTIETTEIRLLDKRQPLQDMAKMLGMFEEHQKQKHDDKPKAEINVNIIEKLGRLYPDPMIAAPLEDVDSD